MKTTDLLSCIYVKARSIALAELRENGLFELRKRRRYLQNEQD